MSEQLDLFGEVETAGAESRRRLEYLRTPQTCPLCGITEPTGYTVSLSGRHVLGWRLDDDRLYTDECGAMRITVNHVIWASQHAPDEMPARVARARQAWVNHPDRLRARLAAHGIDLDEWSES